VGGAAPASSVREGAAAVVQIYASHEPAGASLQPTGDG
jgi:hypothetical protein